MFNIPNKENKRVLQPNLGDTQGNLAVSFNLDTTTNLGRIRNTRSSKVLDGRQFEIDFITSVRPAMGFAWYDFSGSSSPELVAWLGAIAISQTVIGNWVLDPDSSSPVYSGATTGNGDIKTFNGNLYVTNQNALYEFDGTNWADISTSPIIGDGIHALDTYGDRLYVVADDAQKIYSVDTSSVLTATGSFTLDLSFFDGHISWIRAGSNRIWIGFTKSDGTRGLIFEWDGQSENIWSKNYTIEAQGSCGCTLWDDVPYTLDTEGRLLAFNGANFQEVARLPLIQNEQLPSRYTIPEGNKLIHFNGITFSNDRILLNIDNDLMSLKKQGSFIGNNKPTLTPGGIWEYTRENGLIHYTSPSMNNYDDVEPLDYGQVESVIPGAVFDGTPNDTNNPSYDATIIYGARSIYRTGSSSDSLYVDSTLTPLKKSGNLVTSWMEADQVIDNWQSIVVKYKKLLDNADKIFVKYRTVKTDPVRVQEVSWNSATEFTFTNANTPFSTAEVGDEVTVIQGIGAGDQAHITNINLVGTTYTVTLDKAIVGVIAGDASEILFEKWRFLKTITNQEQYSNCPIPAFNKDIQIQVKLVLEWLGDNELYEIMVINNTEQYAK